QASSVIRLRTTPLPERLAKIPKPNQPQAAKAKVPSSGSGTQTTTYEWDFGDGVQLGTVLPNLNHDYGPRLDAQHVHQVFHASVIIHAPDAKPAELRRSIVVANPY